MRLLTSHLDVSHIMELVTDYGVTWINPVAIGFIWKILLVTVCVVQVVQVGIKFIGMVRI